MPLMSLPEAKVLVIDRISQNKLNTIKISPKTLRIDLEKNKKKTTLGEFAN